MENSEVHIALDTETTGVDPKKDRIVEIALRKFNPKTGEIYEDHKHWIIDPEMPIPLEAEKVHGISNETVKGKPKFSEIVDEMLEFCEGQIIVIHNKPFDVSMLNAELDRIGRDDFEDGVEEIIDTLVISRTLRNKVNTLDALCDKYEVDRSSRILHGALTDCDLLAQVFPGLMADYIAVIDSFSTILSFDCLQDTDRLSLDDLISQSLELDNIRLFFESLRRKRNKKIKELVDEFDYEGPTGNVTFQPRVTTNWKRIRKDYLVGKDLSIYQTATSAMYVTPKEEVQAQSDLL